MQEKRGTDLNWSDTRPGLSIAELESVGRKCGIELPESYKTFLQLRNGGRPSRRRFRTSDGQPCSAVKRFLAVYEGEGSLEDYVNTFAGRIPDYCFPIANDAFGNLVLMGFKGNQRGKIFFWDHEEDDDFEPEENLLVESLDLFLTGLEDDDVE